MSDRVDEEKRQTLRRFAALGAASPLVGVGSARAVEPGESEPRSAIVGYVARTPGAHFSNVRDALQLGTGEAQHHLRALESADRVVSEKDGDFRRYFLTGSFSTFERRALGVLRRETPRRLVIALLRRPQLGPSALADRLGVSPSTISQAATTLGDAEMLTREDGYVLEKPETVLMLLVRYAHSFDVETVRFAAQAADLVEITPTE